ncbi:hypothetical protein RI129_006899 [Pyrocoelia pectoralis]|uniref:Uncharacterized protein n=1 Tax=Pyrocoelia pectoralis TaxID=417401 RepID=A0AAN7VKE7_9COLE
MTPMEACQMLVDADLSQRQYEVIRQYNKKFFPCYTRVQKAKRECYPPPESCTITSTSAEVQLQPLMDVTVRRLAEYLEEVLTASALNDQERENLTLLSKWGCDGSQQTQFKQKFENDTLSDANLFQSCFVPLKLICGEKVIWENPTPSSPRFCRLIRFRYIKESPEVINEEIFYINNAINSLTPTVINLAGAKFIVKYIFTMTMVDGKVCNAATGTTSTSRCYICGATSKDFNKLDYRNEINSEATAFGLSVLHARIRLLESILHLAYKLPVKKYRERKTEEEKQLEKERKEDIQTKFRKQLGLLVDMPKTNFGNTNDGNTSRRFFSDPKIASDITGISYNLIYRLKVILEAISSGHLIDPEKYDRYGLETARLYVDLYPWHPMTPTMHKVLLHGAVIIKKSLLPIGQLSEEAAEARNKHFRSYRIDFARKFSRESCNQDILNKFLLTSDPFLSSKRSDVKKRKLDKLLPETIDMLLPAIPNPQQSSDEENISDENI